MADSVTTAKNRDTDTLRDVEYILVSYITFYVTVQVNDVTIRKTFLKTFSHSAFCYAVEEIAIDDIAENSNWKLLASHLSEADEFPFLTVEVNLGFVQAAFPIVQALHQPGRFTD